MVPRYYYLISSGRKIFRLLAERYCNQRRRLSLRFNLIAGLYITMNSASSNHFRKRSY
jgi:hypothetical protein